MQPRTTLRNEQRAQNVEKEQNVLHFAERSRRSMDRIYPCGGYDVGSIPTGSTKRTNTCPAAGFVVLC